MAALHQLKSNEEVSDFIKKNSQCVIEFFTTGCMKCKYVQQELKDLEKSSGHIKFASINAQDFEDVIEQHDLVGFPTVIFFKDGKEVARTSSEDVAKLEECLEKLG